MLPSSGVDVLDQLSSGMRIFRGSAEIRFLYDRTGHFLESRRVVTLRTAPTDRSVRSDLGSSEQFRRIDRSGRGIGRSGRGISRG